MKQVNMKYIAPVLIILLSVFQGYLFFADVKKDQHVRELETQMDSLVSVNASIRQASETEIARLKTEIVKTDSLIGLMNTELSKTRAALKVKDWHELSESEREQIIQKAIEKLKKKT
jgi:hypothetical protein